MAGSVHDIDGQPAVRDRGVLGQDRDALLPLQVTGVEHPVGDLRVRAERPRLPQHRVDQRGLAVVDVRDDRDVAQVIAGRELRCAGRHDGRLRKLKEGAKSAAPLVYSFFTT